MWDTAELSETGKVKIAKLIEAMPLDIGEKVNLLLVKFGLKPNCVLHIRSSNPNYFIGELELFVLPPNFVSGLLNSLNTMELTFVAGNQFQYLNPVFEHTSSKAYSLLSKPIIEIREVFVGNDAEELSSLLSTKTTPKTQEDHLKLGELFGYPSTARYVFAYDTEKKVDSNILNAVWKRPTDRELDLFRFLSFIPSKEHFEEELKMVKEIHDSVRKYSPILYEKVIRFHERVQEKEPTEEMRKFLYTKTLM